MGLVLLVLVAQVVAAAPVVSGYWNGRRLPADGLKVEVAETREPGSGAVRQQITARNTGTTAGRARISSLVWELPAGEYELTYLNGGWGQEFQLATERIGPGARVIGSRKGRSSNGFSPWFSVRNNDLGKRWAAQFEYSGNWEARFERMERGGLRVELCAVFDNDGDVEIPAGGSFAFPAAVWVETNGDLDDAANALHRYQRTVIPKIAANRPPLVQFNSWYPYGEKIDAAKLKETATAAAEIGAEVFVVDSGWYVEKNWEREVGNWRANPAKFPHGLGELADHVRAKGMKFGIWTEIENAGVDSQVFREHPEWCLARDGKPVIQANRCQLNFAKGEVREWARAVVDRLVREAGIEWIKIDYNIDIGNDFDGGGDTLYRHPASYYGWLDEIRRAHPGLIVENCASGGLRFDLGIIAHTHATWLSDRVLPVPSVQLAYGCTVAFAPEICNHWMVGDQESGEISSTEPEWWDFLFRVPMNGQFGVSSRILEWPAALRNRAAENVALYKRIRETIAEADVYHLTEAPSHEAPTGWMAVQYRSNRGSVVLAYRLGGSAPARSFRLRGLEAGRRYRVSRDGAPGAQTSGAELMESGLTVALDREWRSAVVEAVRE